MTLADIISTRPCITHPSHPTMELDLHFQTDEGWKYATYNVGDDDCQKLLHYAICDECCLEIDWGNRPMTREDVALWFALGAPAREGSAPLNDRDLKHLATCKLRRVA